MNQKWKSMSNSMSSIEKTFDPTDTCEDECQESENLANFFV